MKHWQRTLVGPDAPLRDVLKAIDSAGVGILNIQAGTLITATRLDQSEADYLHERAAKFMELAKAIQAGG